MRRPMSIYRVDKDRGTSNFYKVEGRGTRGMATLTPGDDFNIAGPLGHGFKLQPGWKNIVVLGRGVGLATLAPLSQLAAEQGVGVTAVLSARHQGVVMSKELFDGLGAHTITVLDSDNSSAVENVEKILERLIAEGKADAFFTCGSNRLLKLMQRLGKKHNIPGQVAMEQIMVCGFGACYVCVRTFEVDGKQVLKARLPGRAGFPICEGGRMVDLSVKIGDITLKPGDARRSGAFSWEYNDVIDLNRLVGWWRRRSAVSHGSATDAENGGDRSRHHSIHRAAGQGIEYFIDHIVPEYAKFKPPLIVSVSSESIDDFAHWPKS
jgi:dihydroorotate dehydrogenase electron transfer subunit